MVELTHLSYSSISRYLNCGKSWQFKYQQQLPEKKSSSLIFGSAFHGAIRQHIQGGSDLRQSWRESWSKELALTPDIDWGTDNQTELFNYGVQVFSSEDVLSMIKNLKPLVKDESPCMEVEVSLSVPGVPVPIIGFIDMIQDSMIPVDFKTSGRSWAQQQADKEMQATYYLAALNQAGLVQLPAKFEYIVLVKNKTPKIQRFVTERSAADVFALFNLVGEVYRAMTKDVFLPNPTGWACSEKYCSFWNECPQGGKS